MTAGSNSNDPGSHHAIHPRDDRESLSSLFDGELPTDVARFALKRLAHDDNWRDTCGRWQLIGDVLRREAEAVAPAGFAGRVMIAVAADAAAEVGHAAPERAAASQEVPPSRRPAAPQRRWLGGAALAASVAVAAVLVVRPVSQPGSPASDAGLATHTAPVTEPRVEAPVVSAAEAAAPAGHIPTSPSPSPRMAQAVPANARLATEPVSPRSRQTARPSAPVQLAAEDRAEAGPSTKALLSETTSATASATSAPQPFHPPADPAVARPWPRAVLPASTDGALTVGFGNHSAGSSRSPSFYPFEPRLPAEETRPQDEESQR